MKKRILLTVLALVCMLALTACGCKHETWIEADCVTAKTCAACGETEGEPLGHSWVEATCEEAKTCSVCALTEGEALGHAWVDATCEAPKTCPMCALTEGEALGHTWLDATTEAPKTCEICAQTEGDRIITDPRFTTASTIDLHGKWVYDVVLTGEMMEIPDFPYSLNAQVIMEFGNDGTMVLTLDISDLEALMIEFISETLYDELAASGYDKAAADVIMQGAVGMTIPEYAVFMLDSMDFYDMMDELNTKGVYYVDGSMLYSGDSWDAELDPIGFVLDGDTLILEDDIIEIGEETTTFTRAAE